jgi:hypothetical protein
MIKKIDFDGYNEADVLKIYENEVLLIGLYELLEAERNQLINE